MADLRLYSPLHFRPWRPRLSAAKILRVWQALVGRRQGPLSLLQLLRRYAYRNLSIRARERYPKALTMGSKSRMVQIPTARMGTITHNTTRQRCVTLTLSSEASSNDERIESHQPRCGDAELFQSSPPAVEHDPWQSSSDYGAFALVAIHFCGTFTCDRPCADSVASKIK